MAGIEPGASRSRARLSHHWAKLDNAKGKIKKTNKIASQDQSQKTIFEDQILKKRTINPGLIKYFSWAMRGNGKKYKNTSSKASFLFYTAARTPKAHAVWGIKTTTPATPTTITGQPPTTTSNPKTTTTTTNKNNSSNNSNNNNDNNNKHNNNNHHHHQQQPLPTTPSNNTFQTINQLQSRRLCKQKREEQGYSCDKSHSEPKAL
ncbi:unnamed protein product [Polarella glacialis]|uniref:Uncharacterized protein n=1 Tax=Polarella glacialis TaxID=89957 RepID=A0A813FCY8_POLGL|nr:unnamed protein product [Polarella glacialis]